MTKKSFSDRFTDAVKDAEQRLEEGIVIANNRNVSIPDLNLIMLDRIIFRLEAIEAAISDLMPKTPKTKTEEGTKPKPKKKSKAKKKPDSPTG